MSMLIDQTKRVLVQGITGREGMARAKLMREYGTQVVAGVTPGKRGQEAEGLPVFDTIQEAWERVGPIDVWVLFIPAPTTKNPEQGGRRQNGKQVVCAEKRLA